MLGEAELASVPLVLRLTLDNSDGEQAPVVPAVRPALAHQVNLAGGRLVNVRFTL